MIVIEHSARTIPKREYFDNLTQEFITIEEQHLDAFCLKLEHSLMSIAAWEAKWHECFIGKKNLSGEQLIDYVRCMTLNKQQKPGVYEQLTQEDLLKIIEYMDDSQSAWGVRQPKKKKKNEKPRPVEEIYYAMIQLGIPAEYEKWHFNRLIALIDYCDYKGGSTRGGGGGGPNKQSQREIMEMYRAMNERNRKRFNSKG